MVMKDIEEGYRAYDIEGAMAKLREGATLNPVDVAKIEEGWHWVLAFAFLCRDKKIALLVREGLFAFRYYLRQCYRYF